MSEKDFRLIFSTNLKKYLDKKELSQARLAELLGVGTTSVYNWANGIKIPRMDKVDAMCSIFGCNRSDLIEDHTETSKPNQDPEVVSKAIELYKRYENLPPEMQREFQDYLAFLQSKSDRSQ